MENQELKPEESLQLIELMIRSAQSNVEDSSFYYLIWGWLVFIAATLQYVLMQMQYENSFIGWAVFMPLGAVITILYSRKHKSKQGVKTYIDKLMNYVLLAYLISLFIVLFFMSKLQLSTYPMVMMVYGIWLFISGGALKFRPLIFGAIINWILTVVAFFSPFETQLLLLAVAVLLGYIIPGHMLQSKFRKEFNMKEANV